MSKVVDERVVSMQFDNRLFEKNVQTSMSTLDKLKKSLNLDGAAKGLDSVVNAAKRFTIAPLGAGVDTVRAKFSALEVMGVTALANITNSAVNAGKRLVSAITVDPIKTGLQEYETQINAVQTILANTSSKGTSLDQVNAALDELNTYADKTIYNFTEMTRNIGTFTAAGVDLDTSVSSIKGIANLAAVSGSTSAQASNAMYQLSQALAAGKVSLMDWNSVVNAGMGGQVFQDALKRTATTMGTNVDALIKKYGSFRESLTQGEWLTTDVLTETLKQFAGAYSEAELIEQGYSKKQAQDIMAMAETATNAATKVKTFTQLVDTLKESLQSGWTQTWEIIIGDFEQAKELWTGVSDILGGMINSSAEARNNLLQGWADGGGREMVIESVKNAFEGLLSVVKPIKEAFREVFPPATSEQLLKITERIRDLTRKFKMTDEQSKMLKTTFKGVFSVVAIGVDFVKKLAGEIVKVIGKFSGFGNGVLETTSSIGEWLIKTRETIQETDMFDLAISKITSTVSKAIDIFSKGIDILKNFGKSIKESIMSSDYEAFFSFFKGIWGIIKGVGSGIAKAFSTIGGGVADLFNESSIFDVLTNGALFGLLVSLGDMVRHVAGAFDEINPISMFDSIKEVVGNVSDVLNSAKESLQAYQDSLKASTLMKIAIAIGILAASLFAISTIDGDSLVKSLTAISVLFGELMGSLALFTKINDPKQMKGVTKSISLMIGMSAAILILTGAMTRLASLSWEEIAKGLIGVGALMLELSIFLRTFEFNGKRFNSTATGILIMSAALLVLTKSVENFGNMSWEQIGKGLAAIGGLLLELSAFIKLTSGANGIVSTGISLIFIGSAMKIFASAVSDFSDMSWEQIGKGLAGMAGALGAVAIATRLMPKNMLGIGVGLAIVSGSLHILSSVMGKMSGMSWEAIGKGLVAIGGSLVILAAGLHLMNGTVGGSASLLIAAGALAVLTPVLQNLGDMSWEQIGKGLLTVAGAFAVVGVAGLLLAPLVPTILSLAGAFALFGLATLGIGAGLTLVGIGLTAIGTGISSLAVSMAAGATSIVASLTVIIAGILDAIPMMMEKIGDIIVAFCQVIGNTAGEIAEAALKLISSVLDSLATYTTQIVDSLLVFLIGVIDALAEHTPELVKSIVNLVGAILRGVIDALNGVDTTNLIKTIFAIGLMSGLIVALSSITGMIPGAMVGVLGVGAVIAELALVLAAIGALAQIPGLEWLIGEGGDFLEKIGTAIGQFVGGIVGGIAKGFTSSLPDMASDLSDFMSNLGPFIDGARGIDKSVLDGVNTLSKALLSLTLSDFVHKVTSFLTFGSSFSDLAEQLVPFGEAMKKYAKSVKGIDAEVITNSANAAKALAELANNLPNSGGIVSWFTGDNELSDFAEQLVPFAKGMKKYSDEIQGLDPETVEVSATAAKALVELADNLPNSGGLVSWFTGDNKIDKFGEQLVPFAKGMKKYSDAISGLDTEAVTASAIAAESLSELANNLPNTGGIVSWFTGDNKLSDFGDYLVPFGKGMKSYSKAVKGLDADAITSSANAAKALSELASNLPNSGGIVSWFTGNNNLDNFGEQLVPFGYAMKRYADAISGIDSEKVTASANAAKTISELANGLPNSDGMVTWFAGDNKLSDFTEQLVPFGYAMSKYGEAVSGINADKVTASANAAKTISELANGLEGTNAIVGWFTGDQTLVDFAEQLVPFGEAMKLYSNAISGIKPDLIVESTTAADSLVKLSQSIPNGENLFTLLNGDKSLGAFAEQLVPFGYAMKQYSAAISGIKPELITESATAADALVSLSSKLQNGGGLVSFFTGDASLGDFAEKLAPFGLAMKRYSDVIKGIEPTLITESATAAESLVTLSSKLSNTGGLVSFFNGEASLEDLASKLVPFGNAMKLYSDSIEGIKPALISESATAAQSLASLVNNLPSTGGLSSIFSGDGGLIALANQLVPFGRYLKAYSDSVVGIDVEAIKGSASAVKAITEVYTNLPKSGGVAGFFSGNNSLTNLAKQLVPLGNAIKLYSDTVNGINVSAITSSASAIKKMIGVINSMSGVNTSGVKSFKNAVDILSKLNIDSFINAFSGAEGKLKKIGVSLVESLVNGIESKQSSLFSKTSEMLTKMTKSISDKSDTFKTSGAKLMSGFASGLSSKKSEISTAVASGIMAAITKISSYYIGFYSAGSFLGSGLVLGISSKKQAAYDAGYALGQAAAQGEKDGQQSNSPSKLTIQNGEWLGEGLIIGMKHMGKKIYDTGYDLGESATNSISGAVSRVVDVLNSDMDTQPVIRPVLDLNDINSGVNMMNSLFDDGSSFGVLANVRSINSAMNRRIQNGSNRDVISAIEGLGRSISNSPRNTYNVGGITYDDGSNVSNAVSALVRAAQIERRI